MAPTVYTPPVNTYIPIGSVTLSATATEVTFSSIPATYRDLVLVANYGSTNANTGLSQIQFNGDSGSNYNDVFMSGNPDNTTSSGANANTTSIRFLRNFFDVNTLTQQGILQVMDYAATDKHKTCLIRNGAADRTTAQAARWASNSAITSIRIFTGDTFRSGSTFSLYAIAG